MLYQIDNYDWLFDCLCEIEWNLKVLKVKWEGIKWLSQNFHFAFWSPREFKLFSTQNPRVKVIWLLPLILNDKGYERIWIPLETISNSKTLSNSMIFMREDKMTSSNHMKYELEVSKNQF